MVDQEEFFLFEMLRNKCQGGVKMFVSTKNKSLKIKQFNILRQRKIEIQVKQNAKVVCRIRNVIISDAY